MTMLLERPAPETSMEGSRARRCIVSGETLPEGRLMRFAVDPEGQVVPDVDAKLPGRGMWVSAERKAIERAAKGLFSRAAGEAVKADAGLASRTEARLVERILSHLGLARR